MKADQQSENKLEILRPSESNSKSMDQYKRHIYGLDEIDTGAADESRGSKGLPCGNKPSQKEIEDHERTHLPFRSWCKHCVFGKGQSHPHYKKEKEEGGIPCISWDYMYMKGDGSKYEEEDVRNELPIVVWKDSSSKAEGAFVVSG